MSTMNLEDVGARLGEVIAGLTPGEPLVLVSDGEPVATLIRSQPRTWPSRAGTAKTEGYSMAPDFDAPLDEFREFME